MIAYLLLVVMGILGFLCVSASFGDAPKNAETEAVRHKSR